MKSEEVRERFLRFFEKKGHVAVPSSPLLSDDPSVLITTAGMQQFKPYYTGERDPLKDIHPNLGRPLGSRNAVSIQKSFRTSDIDEVGDETHLTFFEMLGNFSFGGYFKDKAIEYGYDFITSLEWMNLKIDKVTVFDPDKVPDGDWRKDVPFDKESYGLWQKIFKEKGIPESLIVREGVDNFWGPTGDEGPCGPTTEIYVANSKGESVEVWNIVFNEYYCNPEKQLTELDTPGVDTGMGLERLMMVVQQTPTVFDTDLFKSIIDSTPSDDSKVKRILADHIRASVYLLADSVEPSNKEKGYILRRLLRRSIFHLVSIYRSPTQPLGLQTRKELNERIAEGIKIISDEVIKISWFKWRETLESKKGVIDSIISREIGRSIDLLKSSFELDRIIKKNLTSEDRKISGLEAFRLQSSFGIPFDYQRDEAERYNLTVDEDELAEEVKRHQEISRAGAEAKFGGHGLLLNTGEIKASNEEELRKVLRLHTATHLLQAALRKVLGNEVEQRGSDVNAERTRFDFTFPRKMTPEEIKQVEDLINDAIKKDLPVHKIELPLEEAKKTGALHFFKAKYPPQVKVYYVGNSIEDAFSKEFCNGPHVERTSEIGQVVIKKEEAISAGVRRIRAELGN